MRADLTKTMSNLGPGPRVKSRPTAVWGDFFIFCQHTSTETLFVSEFQKRLSRWSLQEMWKRDQDPKDKRGENGSAHPAVAGVKVQTRPRVNYAKDSLNQHSSVLVFSRLEKSITYGCDHYGAGNNHFPVYLSVCSLVTTKWTTKQTTGWSLCKPALDSWEGTLLQ